MERKPNPSSTGFEKHPDPRIEESREAFRKEWGYDPPNPHVTLLPPELRLKPKSGAQREAEQRFADARSPRTK
jgi:hypothetical protein